jgi:hypothetical protein
MNITVQRVRPVGGTVTVALVAALVGTPLEAQESSLPMQPYGQLGGCSEKPAEFHRCALEKAKTFEPPRMPDGRPDFRGYWARARISGDNIEEYAETWESPGGVSMVVDPADGKIPYQPWAVKTRDGHRGQYHDSAASCFVPAPPRTAYTPGGYQILQTAGGLTFLHDAAHAYRNIPTDGRPPLPSGVLLGVGGSRGRWEGNTLVVEVTNLRGQGLLDIAGNFYSDSAHILERWTMIAPDAIHFAATITDARVYTRPWTLAFGIRRNTDATYELWENACYEGDRSGLTAIGLKRFPYGGVTVPR